MKKVEKELDLIISDEVFKENQKRELMKDETRRNYRKQQKMEVTSMKIIIGIALIFILYIFINVAGDLKTTGYNNCMSQGYDQAYCLKNS